MDIDETRAALLDATLPHVAFDGWTRRALLAGAADLGLDPALAQDAFPGDAAELFEFFSATCDSRMLAALEERDITSLRVRERVAVAVRTRLEVMMPQREAVRRGVSFAMLPHNVALGIRCLYRTVDAIWYAAGDRATDYNFYSKRFLLAGVYSTTLLVWLNDRSEDRAETWAFLNRRIDEVLRVGSRLGRVASGLLDLPDRLVRPRARAPRR